jgi:phosphohistidine phosphatase
MKKLLIMRHAKSSWGDNGLADHDRPLNKRGQRDAPRMGRFLASEGLHPEEILSSTALRAQTTARLTAEAAQWPRQISEFDELYHASPREAVLLLQQSSDDTDCVLLVAHNPGVGDLVASLTGEYVGMVTASVAQIELSIECWQDLTLEPIHSLRGHWYPKGLPDDFA